MTTKQKVLKEINSLPEYLLEEAYRLLHSLKPRKKSDTKISLKEKYKDLPIEWAKGKPSIDDFAGIWEGNDITLEEIRKSAWKKE